MVKESKALEQQLEKIGFELCLIRNLKSKVEDMDKKITGDVKEIMLEKLKLKSYKGEKLEITCREQSKPQEVNAKIAGKNVPYKDFLKMINVDRDKFEAYLSSHKIKLNSKEYLISPGSYYVIEKPVIKLPINSVKEGFKKLYEIFVNSVIIPKKSGKK